MNTTRNPYSLFGVPVTPRHPNLQNVQKDPSFTGYVWLEDMAMITGASQQLQQNWKTAKIVADTVDDLLRLQLPASLPREFLQNELMAEFFPYLMYFPALNAKFIKQLARMLQGKKVLEVMGGAGYLSYYLQQEGTDIICTDNYSWLEDASIPPTPLATRVEKLDALAALAKYPEVDYVLLSWPEIGKISVQLLWEMAQVNPDCTLIYIGEWKDDPKTAGDEFLFNAQKVSVNGLDKLRSLYQPFKGNQDTIHFVKLRAR